MIYLGLNEVRFPCRVSSLVTCKILDTDSSSTIFEIQTTDNQMKYFRAIANANCEELWTWWYNENYNKVGMVVQEQEMAKEIEEERIKPQLHIVGHHHLH